MAHKLRWWSAAVILAGMILQPAWAQQVTVTTPLVGIHDSFYENFNIGWGFQHSSPNGSWFMNFGGPVIPPFGGYNPNNDFRFGLGTRGNGNSAFFNLTASQGSNRTMTMTAPSLTMMNGVPGQIFSGTLRPFVTGLIPVVGDYPGVPYVVYPPYAPSGPPVVTSPLMERLERLRNEPARPPGGKPTDGDDDLVLAEADAGPAPAARSAPSSAERGDVSVAEIRRSQALEDESKRKELEQLIEEARAAERAGQLAVARVLYRQAAARASGDQQRELLDTVAKLKPRR